jgi:hypothetical protein
MSSTWSNLKAPTGLGRSGRVDPTEAESTGARGRVAPAHLPACSADGLFGTQSGGVSCTPVNRLSPSLVRSPPRAGAVRGGTCTPDPAHNPVARVLPDPSPAKPTDTRTPASHVGREADGAKGVGAGIIQRHRPPGRPTDSASVFAERRAGERA